MMRLGLLVAAAVLVLDQVSKWWILAYVMQPPRDLEITPFFNLVLAWNRGVSFSLFANSSAVGPWLLAGLALVIVGALLWWLRRVQRRLPAMAIGLVVGGALGNVIDRMRFGAVVDFLDFHAGRFHWPAFNLADSAISIGVVLLLLDGLFAGAGEAKIEQDEALDARRGGVRPGS